MSEFTRITVPLSKDEFYKLRDIAMQEYRHPRDHARYILRNALGLGEQTTENKNGDALALESRRVTIGA